MGAESSSLQAINSLNDTLVNLERKLGVIEDVHLHHERTICHDNTVLVSGKQITSNPGVELVVGPIVGLITQNSVRILVESNITTILTVNFFIMDELHTEARFVEEVPMPVKGGVPVATTFDGLRAGTNYAAYIGGCQGQTTIMDYAQFTTLPKSDSCSNPRILFSHGGRIDRQVPNEVNLWQRMSETVGRGSRGRDAAKLSSDNTYAEITAPRVDYNNDTCHMVVHLGDFLEVDKALRCRAVELLDMITREDVSVETWDGKLREAEEAVRDIYRRAFNDPAIKPLLRKCGHLFLAADGEAGSLTSSYLGIAPGVRPQKSQEEQEAEDAAAEEAQRKADAAAGKAVKKDKSQMGFRARQEAERKAKEAEEKALAKKRRGPLKRGEIDEDLLPVDSAADLLVPAVGGVVRRQRESMSNDVDARQQVNEELRTLLLGAILRILRRVSWVYLRQLWDVDFEELLKYDTLLETNQRAVLKTRKYLQIRILLQKHLEATKKKLVTEFGEEYKASSDVKERCAQVGREVEQVEGRLRALLTESALLVSNAEEPRNGICLDLGGVVLVLLESCWGWLGKDGLAQTIYNRDMPIAGKIVTELESLLFEGRGKNTPTGDEVRTVLCASSAPLVPYQHAAPDLGLSPSEPQSFQYAPLDVGKVLKTIALWQQRSPERATLLASACPRYAASGWTYPIIEESHSISPGKAKKGTADDEGWNGERCKMRTILVSAMSRQIKAKGESRYAAGESRAPREPIINERSGFVTSYDNGSTNSRKTFWNALSFPATKPRKDGDSWVQGKDAGWKLQCVADLKAPVNITVGPVIGRVTPSSATVLLQAMESCHVELLCIDQVTGWQFTNSKFLTKDTPSLFTFNNLTAGRAYDVRLATDAGYTLPTHPDSPIPNQAALLVRGSFTTPALGSWDDYAQEHRDLVAALRDEAHRRQDPAEGDDAFSAQAMAKTNDAGDGSSVNAAGSPSKVVTRGDYLAKTPTSMKAFIVGAMKPSWLRLLPHEDAIESDESALGLDRLHLAQGLHTLQTVADIAARSWGPVGHVIHVGYSVDINACMDSVLSLVTKAEASNHVGEVDLSKTYIDQAESALRGAYKLHWGGSSARQLYAHSSHLIVSNPMLTLLHAFNCPTLRQLQRDLSPYTVTTLLRLVSKLNSEYEMSLWEGGVSIPNSDGFMRFENRVHFASGGSVALFPLQLRTLSAQDNYGTSEDSLLSEYVFDSLLSLLGSGSTGSAAGTQESGLNTLVIVSPLPLIHNDPQLIEGTFLSCEAVGMAYSPSEVLRILDILCSWVSDRAGREVIIICGGVDVGHGTTIVGQLLVDKVAPDDESEEEEEQDFEEKYPISSKTTRLINESKPSDAASPSPSKKEKEKQEKLNKAEPASPSPTKKSGWGMGSMFSNVVSQSPEVVATPEEKKGPTQEEIEAAIRKEEKIARLRAKHEKKQLAIRKRKAIKQREAARKAQPVVIKQLCVAPLVGVPGHEYPVREGIMVSKERAYTYRHDNLDSTAHCGFMQIFDNRANVAAAKEVAQELDLVRAPLDGKASSPPPSLKSCQLDLVDYSTLSSYVADDDVMDSNNLSLKEGKGVKGGADEIDDGVANGIAASQHAVMNLSVLKDADVLELWKHASAHLSGNRKRKANVRQDEDAMDLSTAVATALDDDAAMGLYPFVHKAVFVTGSLPLPMSGGVAVEDTLLAACRILLTNLPRESQELCPMPSSLVCRLVWSKLVSAEAKLHRKAESSGTVGEKLPTPVEMVVASLTSDPGYLAYTMRQAIEAQALLEHFGQVLGYCDM